MPAAAIPVGAALAAPAVGAAGADLLGAGALATTMPWLTSAAGGALTGGLGSYIMGQDPMKGALFGGIGGGLSGAIPSMFGSTGSTGAGAVPGGDGALATNVSGDAGSGLNTAASGNLGSGLGASSDISGGGKWGIPDVGAGMTNSSANDATLAANGLSGSSASDAAKTGSLLGSMGKIGPMAALTLGSLALNKATAVPTNNVTSKLGQDYKQPLPMNRQYVPVDPNSFLTASPNRTYFNNVNPTVQYARGGPVRRMADGGAMSAVGDMPGGMPDMSVGMPSAGMPVNGPGDGMQDKIPAKLSDGEFVVSSPVVSALGNGSNKAGAMKLNKLQKNVHKRHFTGGKPKKALGLSSYMH